MNDDQDEGGLNHFIVLTLYQNQPKGPNITNLYLS